MSKTKRHKNRQAALDEPLEFLTYAFVALSADGRRVLASGSTLDDVVAQLSFPERDTAHILRVLPCQAPPYIPSIQI